MILVLIREPQITSLIYMVAVAGHQTIATSGPPDFSGAWGGVHRLGRKTVTIRLELPKQENPQAARAGVPATSEFGLSLKSFHLMPDGFTADLKRPAGTVAYLCTATKRLIRLICSSIDRRAPPELSRARSKSPSASSALPSSSLRSPRFT